MLLDSLDCEHSSQESCALATDHLWSHSSLDPSQHASSVETMAQPESNDSRLFIAGYDIVNVDQESSWMETRRSSVANTLHEDTTDLLPEAPSRPPEECQPSRDHALQRIESIFEEIADSLLSERREVTISFPLHRKARDGLDGPGSSSTEEPTQSRFISFPGKTAEEAWRFCQSRIITSTLVADGYCSCSGQDTGADARIPTRSSHNHQAVRPRSLGDPLALL